MDRLKQSLEAFDEVIFKLEDQFTLGYAAQRDAAKKHTDLLKESRSREANVLATAQKVATRLDQAIEHVERVLRDNMSKLAITLYGREYFVNCDPGEEGQLKEIVRFVEGRMQQVSNRAGNTTELRLLMLTCLHLADELLDYRRKASEKAIQDEDLLVAAVDHLRQRVIHVASQIGRA